MYVTELQRCPTAGHCPGPVQGLFSFKSGINQGRTEFRRLVLHYLDIFIEQERNCELKLKSICMHAYLGITCLPRLRRQRIRQCEFLLSRETSCSTQFFAISHISDWPCIVRPISCTERDTDDDDVLRRMPVPPVGRSSTGGVDGEQCPSTEINCLKNGYSGCAI